MITPYAFGPVSVALVAKRSGTDAHGAQVTDAARNELAVEIVRIGDLDIPGRPHHVAPQRNPVGGSRAVINMEVKMGHSIC
ncbi:hypothetical protein ABFT80_23250 [Mesorhizobium sp. SB112]|uniref:hypothetical protein n=1 Tax=Mesorhizobium sp. SB112 TaxID=3151853 RepID=UPI003263E032